MKTIIKIAFLLCYITLSASAQAYPLLGGLTGGEVSYQTTVGGISELENQVKLNHGRYKADLNFGNLLIGARRDETELNYKSIEINQAINWLGSGFRFSGFGDNKLTVYHASNIDKYWLFDFENKRFVRPRWKIVSGAYHQFKQGGGGRITTGDAVKTGIRLGVEYDIAPQLAAGASYEINNISAEYVEDKLLAGVKFKF